MPVVIARTIAKRALAGVPGLTPTRWVIALVAGVLPSLVSEPVGMAHISVAIDAPAPIALFSEIPVFEKALPSTGVGKRGALARRRVRAHEVAQFLEAAGFPLKDIPKLVCTALYESAFDPRATNRNRNGSQDTGLFQINDLWLKECKLSRADLFDPVKNVSCALRVYTQQGLAAWYAYEKKKEKCNAYVVKSWKRGLATR